jgi:hypothetical protein
MYLSLPSDDMENIKTSIIAMTQAVCSRASIAEARVQYQSFLWDLWYKNGIITRFYGGPLPFPCHYHSTNDPCSFIYHRRCIILADVSAIQ